MLFPKELQSVKPGIIFNKVSVTLGDSHQRVSFTKYLRYYDKLWQLRGSNSLFNAEALQTIFMLSFFSASWFELKLFHGVLFLIAYADEAHINPVPLAETPWLLQIEWTAKSETPITIFRVQFMVRRGNGEIIIRNWIACYN